MTVWLNPRDMVKIFCTTRQHKDQEAYAPVADVKIEVYEAFQKMLDSGATLTSIKLGVQERLSDLYAGKVDG